MLSKRRIKKNPDISRHQLEENNELTARILSDYENGKSLPSFSKLEAMSNIYDFDFNDFREFIDELRIIKKDKTGHMKIKEKKCVDTFFGEGKKEKVKDLKPLLKLLLEEYKEKVLTEKDLEFSILVYNHK